MKSVKVIHFPSFKDSNGTLGVYESGACVPFEIKRVFTVAANGQDVRGQHAHKKCTQLLICSSGKIRVRCDDGVQTSQYVLDDMSVGLLVPAGIWASQEYLIDGSILMVLCDRGYEESDYIRDYNQFISSKNLSKA